MITPQSSKSQLGFVQNVPKALFVDKVIGQQISARVIQTVQATEVASIKVANGVLSLRTPIDLQAGQQIQLEWVEQSGKPTLKLVLSSENNQQFLANLKVDQQLPVEIVKLLSKGRVLVQTLTSPNTLLDIDISQLSKQFKAGDKLMMDIISIKPLQIQLQPESAQQKISKQIQQLLVQQTLNPSLTGLIKSVQSKPFPEVLQQSIDHLLQTSLDKSTVTQSNELKRAMLTSGTFSEKNLLTKPSVSNQDFKANLARVLAAVETVMTQVRGQTDISEINKLPGQVLSALASQGKTVEQLLHVLLSGKTPVSPATVQSFLPGLLDKEQALLLTQMLASSSPRYNSSGGHTHLPNLAELMTMFKGAEAVYNKLHLNQLLMLKDPDASAGTTATWLFDIPIKNKEDLDLLQLQIEQYKKQNSEDDEIWNVQLRVDTQNLGPVQATVTLVDEDVKIIFRAERNESTQLLQENNEKLLAALNELGISASHINFVCGKVNQEMLLDKIEQLNDDSKVDISV